MNASQRAREVRFSRVGGRRFLLIAFTVAIVLVGLAMTMPVLAQSITDTSTNTSTVTTVSTSQSTSGQSTANAKLSSTSEGAGVTIGITVSGFVANHSISVKFGNMSLSLSPTCTTNSAGGLSGQDECSFVVPNVPSGSYKVTISDGTNNSAVSFKVPVVTIPESTLLVTMTSIGLSLVTQLVTRRVVNLDAERRMKAEISAFNKEKRAATLAKDKTKLERLKKRELPMRQEQAKVSSARLKVTAITFVPLLGVYYLMASFLGGFSVIVAYSPVPIPLLVSHFTSQGGNMALFWWYMLSSFTFSTLLTKLLHTTT
jgi:uncharacterized membrane protein (DUF106 family)